jgi:hypothetical protein
MNRIGMRMTQRKTKRSLLEQVLRDLIAGLRFQPVTRTNALAVAELLEKLDR